MSRRVLVIDDHEPSRELLRTLLGAFGFEMTEAADGTSGLAAARQAPPDLVLCDLQLPGIDGFEVLERLRREPGLRAAKVLAVTGYALPGDRERVLAAGFDGYLSKPIEPETLSGTLEEFLG